MKKGVKLLLLKLNKDNISKAKSLYISLLDILCQIDVSNKYLL